MLKTNGRSLERLLLYGMEGVGKSLAALDIAAAIHPAIMYVIDNDNAWDRMLEGQTIAGETVNVLGEWRWDAGKGKTGGWEADDRYAMDGGNVVVFHADGWVANTSAIEQVVREAGVDDWCCVDTGTALWSDVQAWFTEQVFGTSMEDYFMQVRMEKARAAKEAKALGALDGWVDWPVINAQYNGRVMKFLITPPCHLLVTAEQADISSDDKDKETRALYGGEQVKPRGQKRLGHNMQSVLRLGRKAGDRYVATTLKDRGGRGKLDGDEVSGRGFAEWYLRDIAGWTEEAQVQKVIAKKGMVSKT